MRRAPLVLVVLLALTGCGQASSESSAERFTGEQKAVAQVVEDLQAAGERKDAEKICNEILSRALVQQVRAAGANCAAELRTSIDDADDFELEVQRVTIRGDRAQAQVKGRSGDRDRTATLTFARENGGWRATSLGAG